MQAKDIPEDEILYFLYDTNCWTTHYPRPGWKQGDPMPSIYDHFEGKFPIKLLLAKLNKMRRRGLIMGCACGCRGDWELTKKTRNDLIYRPKPSEKAPS